MGHGYHSRCHIGGLFFSLSFPPFLPMKMINIIFIFLKKTCFHSYGVPSFTNMKNKKVES